jgi:hypothetical protein
MAIQIQLRRGTSTEWTSSNPILAQGELALEINTGRFKTGNGVDRWNSLSYNGFIDQGNDPSNWDTNSKLGIYFVNRANWGGTTGTPTESYSTGMLLVYNTSGMVIQKYQPADSGNGPASEFSRSRLTSGSWTSWIMSSLGEGSSLDGGTF